MGGTHHPPLSLHIFVSWNLKGGIKKIPTLTAFFKLLWGDVKVEALLISWHILVVFWLHPLPPFDWHPQFLVNDRCQYQASFIYMRFVVPQFSMLKSFLTGRKYHFRFVLSDFVPLTPTNIPPFLEVHHKIYLQK